jgi:hypothetical protein
MHPQIKAHPEAHGIFSTWEEGSPSLLPSLSRRTGEAWKKKKRNASSEAVCYIFL